MSNREIITSIDEYFLHACTPVPYPSILIESKNIDALPVIIDALEPGEVSVIFEHGDKFNVAKKKISNSAITLAKMLSVYKFTILLSRDKRVRVSCISDLMEVSDWTP